MLQTLRNKTKLIMAIIILLIVPAFVLWGVSSAIVKKRESYAGKVFGQKISIDEYNNSFLACQINALLNYGDKYDQVAHYLNFNQKAWERVILLHEANKQGIVISDEELVKQIEAYPFFQEKGVFSKERYTYILAKFFKTMPEAYEKVERGNLMLAKMISYVMESIFVSDSELFKEYKSQKSQVKAQYVFFSGADFEKDLKIDPIKVKEFYENNKGMFKTQEQRQIDFINITFAKFNVQISEKEIADFYETNKDLFKIKSEDGKESIKPIEEVKDLITMSLKIKAQKEKARKLTDQIVEALLDNKTATDIIKIYPEASFKETAFFSRYDEKIDPIPAEDTSVVAIPAFNMKPGEISDMLEGSHGFYIVKLKKVQEPTALEFEKVKTEVEKAVSKQMSLELAKTAAQNFREKISTLIKNGSSFEKAASELNLQVKTTNSFNLHSMINEEIGNSENFKRFAFNLNIGQVSDIVNLEKGTAFLSPIEKQEPSNENFEKDKNMKEFKDSTLKNKQNYVLTKWMSDLEKKANLQVNPKVFNQKKQTEAPQQDMSMDYDI